MALGGRANHRLVWPQPAIGEGLRCCYHGWLYDTQEQCIDQEARMFFSFPENARWDPERQAVEFGVEIGEYQGVVRVARRVFQRLLAREADTGTVRRSLLPATGDLDPVRLGRRHGGSTEAARRCPRRRRPRQ